MSRACVLMYHGFGERTAGADPENLFVPVPSLEQQLGQLLTRGWTALDLDGWLAQGGRARRSFLVTIDDGYVSTLELAAPVLERYRVPAVLFVPPARLGGTSAWMPQMPDEPLLPAERLSELAAYGVEVGAHGFDHTLLRTMDDEQLRHQTAGAAETLADLVGYRPRAFAYPEGVHDAAAVDAVRAAGYVAGFSVDGRSDGGADARFAAARVDVNATDTARTFRLKTSRCWPVASSLARRAPGLRSAVHTALGKAR